MRTTYKNKRDYYKAQAEQLARDKADLEAKVQSCEKEKAENQAKEKKRYDAIVYCTNCKQVASVSIPPGLAIEKGDCTVCRVRGNLLFVARVNCDRTI